MYRHAPVVKAGGNHLKWFRAHHPDTVIEDNPEIKDITFPDMVLQLLNALCAERIRSHQDVNRSCLFDQVNN